MASDWIRRNSRRRIVLLDTSAIFMIFENSIRIEDELNRLLGSYDIKIIQEIFNEINLLKEKGSGKQKLLAKTSLSFIKRYEIIPCEKGNTVDDALLMTAKSISAIVVTNDKELRKKLVNEGIQTICLRGKNQLMIC